jgi:uncharacterized protein
MANTMSSADIEEFLGSNVIYRLACQAEGKLYLLPMTYAYSDGAMYSFSHEGLKMEMMRMSPEVCVEVETLEGPESWRCVIAWGRFEELSGEEARRGAQIISERLAMLPQSGKNEERLEKAAEALVFRINLHEKSGRYERP